MNKKQFLAAAFCLMALAGCTYAYKLIRQMNEELAKTGCITISGRIDRKFFHEKFYGTRAETARKGE